MAVTAAAIGAWAAANAGTIAAVSTAVSVAAAGYQTYSQQQAAKAQAKAQSDQNEQLAIAAARSYDDLTPAEIDAQLQAQDLELENQQKAIQARGRVNVFAAASGTMGGSIDSQLYDIEAQKSKNVNTILQQRESGLFSIKQQAESARQGAINSQSKQSIQVPSWLETGLKIGSSVIQGFDNYGRMNETFKMQGKANQTPQVSGGV